MVVCSCTCAIVAASWLCRPSIDSVYVFVVSGCGYGCTTGGGAIVPQCLGESAVTDSASVR